MHCRWQCNKHAKTNAAAATTMPTTYENNSVDWPAPTTPIRRTAYHLRGRLGEATTPLENRHVSTEIFCRKAGGAPWIVRRLFSKNSEKWRNYSTDLWSLHWHWNFYEFQLKVNWSRPSTLYIYQYWGNITKQIACFGPTQNRSARPFSIFENTNCFRPPSPFWRAHFNLIFVGRHALQTVCTELAHE